MEAVDWARQRLRTGHASTQRLAGHLHLLEFWFQPKTLILAWGSCRSLDLATDKLSWGRGEGQECICASGLPSRTGRELASLTLFL